MIKNVLFAMLVIVSPMVYDATMTFMAQKFVSSLQVPTPVVPVAEQFKMRSV